MKKQSRQKLLLFILLGAIVINITIGISQVGFSLGYPTGDDKDNDGVSDTFEELNYRNIEVEYDDYSFEIDSVLREGPEKDEIEVNVNYENELSIEISYYKEDDEDSEIEFGVLFQQIIEFNDTDNNGIFNSSTENSIQNFSLNSISLEKNRTYPLSEDTNLYYFKFTTDNNNFSIHMYMAEEFTIYNETLINPTQAKLDIEISNFNYTTNNSSLALQTNLISEYDYEEDDDIEEENEEGDDVEEEGIEVFSNGLTGIFSWQRNATIDGKSKIITTTDIEINNDDKVFYLVYPHGTEIYHDPNIGMKNILKYSYSDQPLNLLFSVAIIVGAVSISVGAVSTYWYYKNKSISLSDEEKGIKKAKLSSTKKDKGENLLKLAESENFINNIEELEDIELAAFSKAYISEVDRLDWDKGEKLSFLREMASLNPKERDEILKKMKEKI